MDIEDIRKNLKVMLDNVPYNIDDVEFVKPGKGRAIYRIRFRNLVDGSGLERTYHSGEKIQEANISTREGQFLYKEGDHYVFMNTDTYDQYLINADQLEDKKGYLKEGMIITTMFLGDKPLDITLPIFIEAAVLKSDIATRTDTVTAQMKSATLETGMEIDVPAFIKEGDVIKVDTRTGTYVERISAKK
ncbi:MAG TPA: elongation factor P [Dehalococcoidales bacterium]|nr:elongation factor P [Dehalococcoidales bacterium]